MFSKEMIKTIKRLQKARLMLMRKQPFYAVLLLHMTFAVDEMCETAYTDGERIVFRPGYIETLSEDELGFVLMHEVMHVALGHCFRAQDTYDYDDFNEACDIVVNSNILMSQGMDLSKITLKEYGESMHLAPDGTEGYEHTVEEVYQMIRAVPAKDEDEDDDPDDEDVSAVGRNDGGFDDHTYWGSRQDGDGDKDGEGQAGESGDDPFSEMEEVWLRRMVEATQIAEQIAAARGDEVAAGTVPLAAERMVKELTEPQTDWRTVLDMFIQEEINDYSFNPPDRRFQDSPFLLPDFNEKDESVKDILFMIDTSASMTDAMISQAYSEMKGAIDQFDGHLAGWLGFFDAEVIPPEEFADEEELRIIRPKGGGGTNFHCIFEYVRVQIESEGIEPASIIILTDGYAAFPDEELAMGIPVLWIINNEKVTPPWGKVTRIRTDDETF